MHINNENILNILILNIIKKYKKTMNIVSKGFIIII